MYSKQNLFIINEIEGTVNKHVFKLKENVMNESNGAIRDARKLGVPKMLILGLQHMFAMFGATILVPILVNSYFVDACGE